MIFSIRLLFLAMILTLVMVCPLQAVSSILVQGAPGIKVNVPLGQGCDATFQLTAAKRPGSSDAVFLYLVMDDLDSPEEGRIQINGHDIIEPPAACARDSDVASGYVPVPQHWLVEGTNTVRFIRNSDLKRATSSYFVSRVELVWGEHQQVIDKLDYRMTELALKVSRSSNSPIQEEPVFKDDFENQSKPLRCWIEQAGTWQVLKDAGQHVLQADGRSLVSRVALHGFSRDGTLTCRVKRLGETGEGGVWLISRMNHYPHFLLRAGYNVTQQQWELRQSCYAELDRVMAFASGPMEKDRWYQLTLKMQGETMALHVNGQQVCQTKLLTQLNYGKFALETQLISACFDDVAIYGQGDIVDGVRECLFPGMGNADLLTLKDGRFLMQKTYPDPFMVSSDGLSWKPDWQFKNMSLGWGKVGNMLRLADGSIVHLFQIDPKTNPRQLHAFSEISHDDGQTWQGPYTIVNQGVNSVMNGKMTLTTQGRILVPMGQGEGGESEKTGGIGVFFSDDHGRTWQQTDSPLNQQTTGFNVQEGHIIELSDGRLAMLMRTPYGFLYQSFSQDQGMTWTMPQATTVPSVMCAFSARRDSQTGHIYLFWAYDNIKQLPQAQSPRERISLAVSTDDLQSWQFLMDVDDFAMQRDRFMNLGMAVTDQYLFPNVTAWGCSPDTLPYRTKLWRIEKSKLVPRATFPQLH